MKWRNDKTLADIGTQNPWTFMDVNILKNPIWNFLSFPFAFHLFSHIREDYVLWIEILLKVLNQSSYILTRPQTFFYIT